MYEILEHIIEFKRDEIALAKKLVSLGALAEISYKLGRRDFVSALRRNLKFGTPAIIAEIKKASPFTDLVRPDYYPKEIAQSYQFGGAVCLSVVTDEQFCQGCPQDLIEVRHSADLPVLRKDFIVDLYQVYESSAIGADCILLNPALLDDVQLNEFESLANDLCMAVLVEVQTPQELERALRMKTPLIGLNNRNLTTLKASIETTLRICDQVPDDRIVVSEAGITTPKDVSRLREAGINSFLVGDDLMRAEFPGWELEKLFFKA